MVEKRGNGDVGSAKGQRSRNYPAIGLRLAVEKVQRLYDADGTTGAPPEAALQHLGYSSWNGQSQTVVSALRKFGLIEDREGRIRPSKRAIDIFEYSESHPRHVRALQNAALEPALYAHIATKYKEAGRVPSDVSLRPELITAMGLNPKSVGKFLEDFRGSLEFAGLLEGNALLLPQSDPEEGPEQTGVGDVEECHDGVSTTPANSASGPRATTAPPGIDALHAELASGIGGRQRRSLQTITVPIGLTREGEVVRAHVTFDRPVKKGYWLRLSRQLQALAEEADTDETEADESGSDTRSNPSE